MEDVDSINAIYCDPNAYIQKVDRKDKYQPRKVVFQEPYEQLPSFYINNNFIKRDCDCVKNYNTKDSNYDNYKKKFERNQSGYNNCDYHCNCENKHSNRQSRYNNNCNQDISNKQNGFGFDLKSLLPLLGMFNKGGGADLNSLVGLLSNNVKAQDGNNLNPMNLISSILSNKDAMSGILKIFKGGDLNLFGKKQPIKKEPKITDFEIKNYTRVE